MSIANPRSTLYPDPVSPSISAFFVTEYGRVRQPTPVLAGHDLTYSCDARWLPSWMTFLHKGVIEAARRVPHRDLARQRVCNCTFDWIAFTPPSIREADDPVSIRVSMMRFGLAGSSTPQPD
ncbi:hypothetical protein [Burkholderia thailandensis]|uniref:hypothetical protein n=1 Tax=Burkholderia thailandensis TaxID=57975 RepID=UPI002D78103C|nr:hypothetical protein [Burkholderia thailandensis]WRS69978.1 hypothetical protein U9S59_29715 [Burkholderia thailandensis]